MKIPTDWQLSTPISAIVFDCDGTLTAIEGINELAEMAGVGKEVAEMTEEAMGKTGISPEIFAKRLNLIQPTLSQVQAVADVYFRQRSENLDELLKIFVKLKKSLYIVSAGLKPAVTLFGNALHIASEHIYAVDIAFDTQGKYSHYDQTSLLIHNNGKRLIVEQIKQLHPRIVHIGDGLNDYITHDLVTRFIGYGGAYYRAKLEAACPFYISSASLAPLLPLSLTPYEISLLSTEEKKIVAKGLSLLNR